MHIKVDMRNAQWRLTTVDIPLPYTQMFISNHVKTMQQLTRTYSAA